jgi:hypothetical protein
MLKMDVIYKGQTYALTDLISQQSHPVPAVTLIQKGLLHIFQPIADEFPGHDIAVLWNEDEQTLRYISNTLDPSVIEDAIKRHHDLEL